MLLGPILQIAYVTNDVDLACARLGTRYGVRNFYRSDRRTLETDDGVSMTLTLAHAWLGDSWLEIIQPDESDSSIFSGWLAPGGKGSMRVHHVGIRLSDLAAWEQTLREVRSLGLEIPLMLTKNREQKYCYVDTTADLGHFTEYLYVPDATRSMLALIPQNVNPEEGL